MSHKNRATLFLIITPAFLGRFSYYLYQWKKEEIPYKVGRKNYHFTLTVGVSTLPVRSKTTYKQHILKSYAFDRTGCLQLSQKVFQCSSFPFFVRKLFFVSLLMRNLSHSTDFLIKILGPYLNSMYLILRSNCMK